MQEIFDVFGSIAAAANYVGKTPEQLSRWRDGKSRPPLFECADLAIAANRSLDWLVTGKEPLDGSQRFDANALQDLRYVVIELENLGERWSRLPPKQKALAISYLMELISDSPDERNQLVGQFLASVA
jgi:transcriptional regulator with XRE-family HTH domain